MAPHTFGKTTHTLTLIPAVKNYGRIPLRFAGGDGDAFLAGKKMSEQSELFFPRRKVSPSPPATKSKQPGSTAYHPKPGLSSSDHRFLQRSGRPSPGTSTATGPGPVA